jgi:hypothetical protein
MDGIPPPPPDFGAPLLSSGPAKPKLKPKKPIKPRVAMKKLHWPTVHYPHLHACTLPYSWLTFTTSINNQSLVGI